MNRFFMALLGLCFLLIPICLQGQEDVDITGRWEGAIDLKQMELEIFVDFELTDDGEYFGEMDIPQQAAEDLPVTNVRVDGRNVSSDLEDVPGNASFEGELSDNGDTLSGDFTQGGQTFQFYLIKEDPQKKAQRKALLQENIEKIKSFCDSMLAVWEPPGFAVGVVYDGEVVLLEGYGYRNLEDSLPVTPQTLYAIGSTTKAFTTAAMGMLADEGILDWDEKVINYLPGFRLKDNYATLHMTPIDLVTHISGMPRHDLLWYNSPFSREEIFSRMQYLEFSDELRATFQYNNLMFMTAGYLVGQLTESTWEEYVEENILIPLEMLNTNFSVTVSQQSDDYALPYKYEGDSVVLTDFRNLDNVGPAGSINSCMEDMVNWLMLHLNNGEFNGRRLISEIELERIHTPHVIAGALSPSQYKENSFAAYSLGWLVQYYRGHKRVWHDGGIDGFYTHLNLYPDDGLGIITFVNLPGNRVIDVVSYYIADLFLGLEPVDWNTRLGGIDTGEEEEDREEDEKQEKEKPVEDTEPSHDLGDYAGQYEHPAYGDFIVEYEDKDLYGTFNNLRSKLEHWHYDVFRATEDVWQNTKINFLTNIKGDIDRISIPLEPAVDNIIFTKKPDAHLYDPEFLSMLAGKYQLENTTCTVELRGENTLFVTVPGQPPYEMEPYKGTEFNLKGLTGFSVEFDLDDDWEEVKGLRFIQPNGVFEAERIESQD